MTQTPEHVHVSRDIQLQAAMYRLGNVEDELQSGYRILKHHARTVTIFGSARISQASSYYQAARELGKRLAAANYTVVTGGGPGIMEAANRGAFEAGGQSIGFNVNLPHEQSLNPYTTESFEFAHFSPRKIVMTMMADAYVFFPGGFGTMDEFTEILTLTQTSRINQAPIILFDKEFWQKWDEFVTETIGGIGLISPGDEKLYLITDDVNEVVETITTNKTYREHES